ncbi:MAG: HAMP domain-containing sensor histidine kinase [Pirellulales bacterium]
MKRPWLPLAAVAAVLVAIAAGLAWLTQLTLRADRHRQEIEARSRQEQQISLALWRMDTMLAPILAREAARPWWNIAPDWPAPLPPGTPRPPQLTEAPDYVKFHFHWPLGGTLTSPQIVLPTTASADNSAAEITTAEAIPDPAANATPNASPQLAAQLNQLASVVRPVDWFERLPSESFPGYLPWQDAMLASTELAQNWSPRNALNNRSFYQSYAGYGQAPGDSGDRAGKATPAGEAESANESNDVRSRSARYQVQAAQSYVQQRQSNSAEVPVAALESLGTVKEGISQVDWIGDRLILARRVTVGDQQAIQGCELDWPRLRTELLAEVDGLLPIVELTPVPAGGPSAADTDPTRHVLAGLPVQLVTDWTPVVPHGWSSIQIAWLLGWIALAVAAAGIFSLVWSLMSLSEKRASFVSAVTHELRTPLTTFRLYSQMLARDMVPAESRSEYLQSLCTQADRLNHLIDNVLTYARLERGRSQLEFHPVAVESLLDRVQGRLTERAQQAEMELVCEIDPSAACRTVTTDQGAIEQVLFNLVDNAAKYAVSADDRRIHCRVIADGPSGIAIAVVDHGPGLSATARRQLFQPFSKSSEQAAASAPGVGLGLALCRRLAYQLGGQLRPAPAPINGIPLPQGCAMILRLSRN